ncbi:MAG: NAD-dependent epimerase/dehydratase family protein [Thermoleophilia bacterium]|nr:NAD-dependent epimerase/dehydratase family protein [Thermoleophilia bacterium]
MRVVVTGAAGFLGSHLTDHLLALGHAVVGIDAFTPGTPRPQRQANLARALRHPSFTMLEADLCDADLGAAVSGADAIAHMAGEAGVRGSWGDRFAVYAMNNLLATQRVLEAAVSAGVRRVAYASSSAVYGVTANGPCGEDTAPRPVSPYGVSMLAGEGLLDAYAQHGLSTAAIRYSCVYGPRQRPGMAAERFITSALTGERVPLYGSDGRSRDLVYVDDAVRATAAILLRGPDGPVNVGSGESFTLGEILEAVTAAVGAAPAVDRRPALAGEPPRERLATERMRAIARFAPATDLAAGIAAQVAFVRGEEFAELPAGNAA